MERGPAKNHGTAVMNRKYKFTNDSLKTPLRQRILLILLDYDGTLVPITSRPEKAIISPSAQNLLSKLNQLSEDSMVAVPQSFREGAYPI